MPHVQDGSRNPPFKCEDIARCDLCLAPTMVGCEHRFVGDDELAERRRFAEHARKGRPRLPCPCHPDCTRTY